VSSYRRAIGEAKRDSGDPSFGSPLSPILCALFARRRQLRFGGYASVFPIE